MVKCYVQKGRSIFNHNGSRIKPSAELKWLTRRAREIGSAEMDFLSVFLNDYVTSDNTIFKIKNKCYKLFEEDGIIPKTGQIISASAIYMGHGILLTNGKHVQDFRKRFNESVLNNVDDLVLLRAMAFVKKNINYVNTNAGYPGSNNIATLDHVVKAGKGVCLQGAVVLATCLNEDEDIVSRHGSFYIVTGRVDNQSKRGAHAWVETNDRATILDVYSNLQVSKKSATNYTRERITVLKSTIRK